MRDYSEMSNAQVSYLVCCHNDGVQYKEDVFVSLSESHDVIEINHHWGTSYKDYCNNPSDAWPIIVENKISLVAPEGSQKDWDCVYGEHLFVDKNPLRAVMIVFLMMKEEEEGTHTDAHAILMGRVMRE